MEAPVQKTLEYVAEIEIAAEDVLADRRQVIDLDTKRQNTRQAIRLVDAAVYVCFHKLRTVSV